MAYEVVRHDVCRSANSLRCLTGQKRQACTGLENRSTLTGTQGSNPCLSAFMNAEKHSVFAETPSFLGVSLRLRPWLWAALICTQSCNSVQTCANPCELYGTIRGTSAPLTAPFFGRFPASRRSEKPVHYQGSAPTPAADSGLWMLPERCRQASTH